MRRLIGHRARAACAACLTIGCIAPNAVAATSVTYESLSSEDQLRIDTVLLGWMKSVSRGAAFNVCDDEKAALIVREKLSVLDNEEEIARLRGEMIANAYSDDGIMDIASVEVADAVRDGLTSSDFDVADIASKRAVLPTCK